MNQQALLQLCDTISTIAAGLGILLADVPPEADLREVAAHLEAARAQLRKARRCIDRRKTVTD